MNNDLVIRCREKYLKFAPLNISQFNNANLFIYLPRDLPCLLQIKDNPLLTPLMPEIVRYLELYQSISVATQANENFQNRYFPKELVDQMNPDDYKFSQAKDIEQFYYLYDLVKEAAQIEEKLKNVISSNKSLFIQNTSEVLTFLKTSSNLHLIFTRHGVGKSKYGFFYVDLKNKKSYTAFEQKKFSSKINTYFSSMPEAGKLNSNSQLEVLFNSGSISSYDLFSSLVAKLPFSKISKNQVFNRAKNEFKVSPQQSFSLPTYAKMYLLLVQDKDRSPSVCYALKKGSGKFVSIETVDDFSQATIFTNIQEAEALAAVVLLKSCIVSFDVSLANPRVPPQKDNSFIQLVESNFTRNNLEQVLIDKENIVERQQSKKSHKL